MPPPRKERVILHLDMDAFYAAVEVREDPALAGQPLIIGHRGRRGVVSTCSYEARTFGVHSAMPSIQAERLCPQGIWLPGRMDLYADVSRRIARILERATPIIEPLSIDEAFLDLTGVVPKGASHPVRGLEEGRMVAAWLKTRIRAEERLTASVGVAPNKFLAKVASDLEKPDGLVLLPMELIPDRLWPLPVERLWGVGPKTAVRLKAAGWRTIGEVARRPLGELERLVGASSAAHLHSLALGEDERPVDPGREARSISEERTYGEDLRDPDQIDRAILSRCEGVARQLRGGRLLARTVHLKIRTGDFTTWTRARTLAEPTDLAEVLVAAARDLMRERIRLGRQGVRLIGVGASGLESTPAPNDRPGASHARQQGLFPDPGLERARRAARAADAVRQKLGDGAITRARLLRPVELASIDPATAPPGAGRRRRER